ncbi:hypothetical protein OEZ85_007364 [Tetradesmus obliquus]|uniref:cyclic pyranopterin monophosphate synthase n=1 Tax=Tetradesmus obliquus TaxID=3088 RepID=A0ABY8TZX4_TETOB|nr:hypothetical protein OEZ85_007364 [Tetradesmus obliquus]
MDAAQQLTHVDGSGRASMVDVAGKPPSSRSASASCLVLLGRPAFDLVKANALAKGDVLSIAQIAGIQGAKQTSALIPLCHNILLSKVAVQLSLVEEAAAVAITATAKCVGQTGVEMEALTAAGVAALTVYDMCKAVSKDIEITALRLDAKEGGKSGSWLRPTSSSSSSSGSGSGSGSGSSSSSCRGAAEISAHNNADLVYNILTDYDSCARVFRNIADTKTVFTPEGGKQVVQACGWSFLAFKGTFDVALAVTEEPGQRLLVFRLVESSFMTDFEGRWQVSPSAPGCCRVEHVLAVKPLLAIPAAVAPYTSSIFKKQVALLLQDLQAEIERQAAAQAPGN